MHDYKHWQKYLKKIGFKKRLNKLSERYKDKKVVIYGGGLVYKVIKENYDLSKLNIIAVCDKSFGNDDSKIDNYQKLKPSMLSDFDFDVILITLYRFDLVEQELERSLTKDREIKSLLAPNYHESMNYNDYKEFLTKTNFKKRLEKLSQKLKGKKVALYGTGYLYEAIKDNYDLSQLNIVAISDDIFDIAELEFDIIFHTDWDLIKTRKSLEKNKELPTIKPIIQKNLFQYFDEIRKIFYSELI